MLAIYLTFRYFAMICLCREKVAISKKIADNGYTLIKDE